MVPIGPMVRVAVASETAAGLLEHNWVNIIDVDAWHVDRPNAQSPPLDWPCGVARHFDMAQHPGDSGGITRGLGGTSERCWIGSSKEFQEVPHHRGGAQAPPLGGVDSRRPARRPAARYIRHGAPHR